MDSGPYPALVPAQDKELNPGSWCGNVPAITLQNLAFHPSGRRVWKAKGIDETGRREGGYGV